MLRFFGDELRLDQSGFTHFGFHFAICLLNMLLGPFLVVNLFKLDR